MKMRAEDMKVIDRVKFTHVPSSLMRWRAHVVYVLGPTAIHVLSLNPLLRHGFCQGG